MDEAKTPEEVVEIYQALGFFASYQPSALLRYYSETWGEPFDPANPWKDAMLLALDEESTWQGDTERDVCEENQVYVKVLPEWAAISDGTFHPTDIEETWESDEGPVTVSFNHGGRRHTVYPKYLDDWMDIGILDQINSIVESKSYTYILDGNFTLVLFLDEQTRSKLLRERKLPIAN